MGRSNPSKLKDSDLDTRDPALAAQLDEDIKRGVNDRREGLGADIDE